MIDADFIRQCSDPGLSVEIVQQFVEEIAAPDHLQVTIKSGDRTFAVPRPTTPEEAMDLTKQHLGQAVVRVGLTQFPAGLGVQNVDDLSMSLFDSCENLRMGTAMFSKIYRIVTKWHGGPQPEAFEDAMLAYASGYFENESVFYAEDPGAVAVWRPAPAEQLAAGQESMAAGDVALDELGGPAGEMIVRGPADGEPAHSDAPFSDQDPNRAPMRINLNGIKTHNVEAGLTGQ